MHSRPLIALAALLLATAPSSVAQQPFTLDHLRRLVSVGGVELSPDGRTAIITVTKPNYERDKNESELWAVDVASGAARQLTFDRRSVSSAHFSPDGRTIAFAAPDTAGTAQIWLLPVAGGEARRLTSHATDVEHFAWRPDGGAIAFAAGDEPPKREGEAKHLSTMVIGDQDLFLQDPVQPQHIWTVDVASGTEKRLTSGTWSLEFVLPPGSSPSALSWSPDGQRIAFAQVPVPQSGRLDSVHVAVVDVATGAIRSLTSARRFENNPVWSPDGKTIAYWYSREGRGDLGWENEVYVAPASGGEGRSITRALDRNLFGAQWTSDGKALLVAGNDRTSVGAWMVPVDGGAPKRLELGDLVINGAFGYDIAIAAHAPTIAFVATAPDRPSELYAMENAGARPRRLTDFNAWARDVSFGTMERVSWKCDQFACDGVVIHPPGFDASKKYPLVLVIHGGPTSASKLSFYSLGQLMANQGWIVFEPNYRGSDNLGNAFQAAITNDAGAGPGRDVMAGVAMLRAKPYVDSARVAVSGWSYGGFMTSWLIGNYPSAWTAAVAGAPVTDWVETYDLADFNITARYAFGGSPWTGNRLAAYRAQSPITYAPKIRAPTLVMSNLEDFRVPPVQAFALWHAMKDNGVETQFVGFKGRTHASSDPVNARERTRLWIEWIRTHLESGRTIQ